MSTRPSQPSIQLPTLFDWQRNLLIALLVLYVVELVARNAGVPTDSFAWWSTASGAFSPIQLFTRFFIMETGRAEVMHVLLGLVVLYFFLPPLTQLSEDRKQLAWALGAATVMSTLLPLAVDLTIGLPSSVVHGWSWVTGPMILLFGLRHPNATIYLIVFPVQAGFLVWGALGVDLLLLVANPGLSTVAHVGAWLGAFAYWHLMGPGARRRQLLRKKDDIEKQLQRFEVIEGGKNKPDEDDEWIH